MIVVLTMRLCRLILRVTRFDSFYENISFSHDLLFNTGNRFAKNSDDINFHRTKRNTTKNESSQLQVILKIYSIHKLT